MYSVFHNAEAQAHLDALPADALNAFAEIRVLLETAPWSGRALVRENPAGAVRQLDFARVGLVVYVVLEEQRRVAVVKVLWAG